MLDIYRRCLVGHIEEGAGETAMRGYPHRYAKLERGLVGYAGGREERLWARDYRTLSSSGTGGALPAPVSSVTVLAGKNESNVLMDIDNAALEETRQGLMAVPQVYRAFARHYKEGVHSQVFTLRDEEIATLLLALYCDRRMHIKR